MTHRTILHIGMNAFFASVEQQSNPELHDRPIAVTGSAARTVVTTAWRPVGIRCVAVT